MRFFRSHHLFHLLLVTAIALALAASITNNGTGRDKASDILDIVSSTLFMVLTLIQSFHTVIFARMELTKEHREVHHDHRFGEKYGVFILLMISVLYLISETFSMVTIQDDEQANNERLLYPLGFLPELVAVMLYAIPGLVPALLQCYKAKARSRAEGPIIIDVIFNVSCCSVIVKTLSSGLFEYFIGVAEPVVEPFQELTSVEEDNALLDTVREVRVTPYAHLSIAQLFESSRKAPQTPCAKLYIDNTGHSTLRSLLPEDKRLICMWLDWMHPDRPLDIEIYAGSRQDEYMESILYRVAKRVEVWTRLVLRFDHESQLHHLMQSVRENAAVHGIVPRALKTADIDYCSYELNWDVSHLGNLLASTRSLESLRWKDHSLDRGKAELGACMPTGYTSSTRLRELLVARCFIDDLLSVLAECSQLSDVVVEKEVASPGGNRVFCKDYDTVGHVVHHRLRKLAIAHAAFDSLPVFDVLTLPGLADLSLKYRSHAKSNTIFHDFLGRSNGCNLDNLKFAEEAGSTGNHLIAYIESHWMTRSDIQHLSLEGSITNHVIDKLLERKLTGEHLVMPNLDTLQLRGCDTILSSDYTLRGGRKILDGQLTDLVHSRWTEFNPTMSRSPNKQATLRMAYLEGALGQIDLEHLPKLQSRRTTVTVTRLEIHAIRLSYF
ncbi:hypothetical protein CVT25_002294 [Psilocybe cyanescens]|uniref:Uncharacterized protein n=1 Tax=Psilocybe cyanescens TaxID=93625 RepID=A0A409WKA6_PSICY|nr:hypothetical protein CVT25_002294 [Psilocybe cyanescens]